MASYIREPISVYLLQDQLDALEARAAEQGLSLDALVREGVDALLATAPHDEPVAQEGASSVVVPLPDDDPLRDIIGMMDSGLGDLALNHDRYLAEIAAGTRSPLR